MFQKSFIPHKGYWSSPFSRWQMSFQNINSIELGAATAKKFLEIRGYAPDMFDGCILGMTIGQRSWFYANPWFCALMGNDQISGPTISQACATSATSIYTAAAGLETGILSKCSGGHHRPLLQRPPHGLAQPQRPGRRSDQ